MGLPNANIVISGTNTGVSSDLRGFFIIKNVPAGKIEIKASFVGYKSQIFPVEIFPGKTTQLNITLEPASVQTEEVIITAQAKGQVEAINRQINSNTIANVVSPERIKENPNANAAEAIGHLPGVSLVRSGGEGTQIIIRGLDAKYSNVTIDGVQLPSTSMTDRSSGISGLSQYLLEGVELFKSVTPDMDGNSVAGSINLALAPAPAGMNFNVLAQTGYNNLNDYWGNYAFQISGSSRYFNDKFGVKLSFDAERVNRGRQTLGASYNISSNITSGAGLEPVYLSTASLNNIQDIKSKQAATLVMDWKFSNESKIIFYNFFSKTGQDYKSFSKSFNPASSAVYYNGDINNEGENLLYSGIIKGNQVFNWAEVDYGASFSQSHVYTPLEKTYTFSLQNDYSY
jgi:TonB-dependent receptor